MRVIAAANAWLHGHNGSLSDINAGHVCQLSALNLKGREGHILHVGDTRVSRVSGDGLEPLTKDQRVVLSAEEIYPGRALGIGADVEIDYHRVPRSVGGEFLLTTDGVHGFLSPDEMARLVSTSRDLDVVAKSIVAGGRDGNLSVLIARVDALSADDAGLPVDDALLPIPPLPNAVAALAKERHLPLAERNPVRFWQTKSAILAVICILLAARLGG